MDIGAEWVKSDLKELKFAFQVYQKLNENLFTYFIFTLKSIKYKLIELTCQGKVKAIHKQKPTLLNISHSSTRKSLC